jgi:hypothetical protein
MNREVTMEAMQAATPRLDDAQREELLDLVTGADSVELKLTIPEVSQRSAISALSLDPLDGQIRQVFFFDTPKLGLERKGVVVRARRVQGKGNDSVVKLRPVVPNELPQSLRESPEFVVEIDAMPGGFVCSGSMKRKLPPNAVAKAIKGKSKVRKLFSRAQRELFEANAPAGTSLDDLAVLGPVFVLKLPFAPGSLDQRYVAEMWLYPDGARILELSTKCKPADALDVAVEARAFLTEQGVDLGGEQQTKTKTALKFFARELAAADGSPASG